MTIHNHVSEGSEPKPDEPVEPMAEAAVSANTGVISFRVNRQTLIVSALVILLVISAFETFELTRLHQALQTWQTLPATAAANATAPAPTAGGNALPAQVGGC